MNNRQGAEWRRTAVFRQLKKELGHTFRFYYKAGDAEYREDYKALLNAVLKFDSDVMRLNCRDPDRVEKLFNELLEDNPLLFYVRSAVISIESSGRLGLSFNYAYTREEAEQIYKRIFTSLKDVRMTCAGLTDEQAVRKVHSYIVRNVEYEKTDELPVHNAESFFVHGKAVCDGVSKAAKILLDGVGVRSMLIRGSHEPNFEHAWNIVWIDGRPSHFDFTFDVNLSPENVICHDYYGLSDDQIRRNHSFTDPGIVATDTDNWFARKGLYLTKKSQIRKLIRKKIRSSERLINFRVPFTKDAEATINEIKTIIRSEIPLGYSTVINKDQMTVLIQIENAAE